MAVRIKQIFAKQGDGHDVATYEVYPEDGSPPTLHMHYAEWQEFETLPVEGSPLDFTPLSGSDRRVRISAVLWHLYMDGYFSNGVMEYSFDLAELTHMVRSVSEQDVSEVLEPEVPNPPPHRDHSGGEFGV